MSSPTVECEVKCALFYCTLSKGLLGMNLRTFLLKHVTEMLSKYTTSVQILSTLSPIPGFTQWILAKRAAQIDLVETKLEEGNLLKGACFNFKEFIILTK
jgi:malonyl-CoA decarboxylase